MNLADWEARLCLPREGYSPEVISCFSWGGKQDRGQARAKAKKDPIRAPGSGLRARKGTVGAVCPDRSVGWGHQQGAGRRQMSHGVLPQFYPICHGCP